MDQTQIADYLGKKIFSRELKPPGIYVILKNKQIYSVGDYDKLVESNQISPKDAFVYIDSFNNSEDESYNLPVEYLFPLIDVLSIYGVMSSYLAKLGLYNPTYSIYPATGLKYYAVMRLFSDRLVIEIVDINTMATNTGLRKIVMKVLGKDILTQKEISFEQIKRIETKLEKQKLFVGRNLDEVYEIIGMYYEDHYTSLAKDVLAITDAYNQIFQPYRVVYDTKTGRQVLM